MLPKVIGSRVVSDSGAEVVLEHTVAFGVFGSDGDCSGVGSGRESKEVGCFSACGNPEA